MFTVYSGSFQFSSLDITVPFVFPLSKNLDGTKRNAQYEPVVVVGSRLAGCGISSRCDISLIMCKSVMHKYLSVNILVLDSMP